MPVEARVSGLPRKSAAIPHGTGPQGSHAPRRVAAAALALPLESEAGLTRVAPLAISAIVLAFTWYLAPERDYSTRVILSLATLILLLVSVVLLRAHTPDTVIREVAEGNHEADANLLPRPANISRDFERFMDAGIANSRRRNRKVGLLEFSFDVQDLLLREPHRILEEIAGEVRDHTRVYDYVHVPGDGTILAFLSHLPPEADTLAIACRVMEDVILSCGSARVAPIISLRHVSLQDMEAARDLVQRLAEQEPMVIRDRA